VAVDDEIQHVPKFSRPRPRSSREETKHVLADLSAEAASLHRRRRSGAPPMIRVLECGRCLREYAAGRTQVPCLTPGCGGRLRFKVQRTPKKKRKDPLDAAASRLEAGLVSEWARRRNRARVAADVNTCWRAFAAVAPRLRRRVVIELPPPGRPWGKITHTIRTQTQ
jgi:hypothetical protein